MLAPIFTLKLNQKIVPRLVTVGRYDGRHHCITAATSGGKVFVHTPHGLSHSGRGGGGGGGRGGRLAPSTLESDIKLLSIGQRVTALTAGRLDPELDRDVLLVGSQTNLLAYDIEKNRDLFYKELPDGANCIVLGQLSGNEDTLAYVGGNCSINGFNHLGEEHFWTVTGDNVCSLALCDFNSDGKNELLVGSEDFDIRVFQNDELLTELSEADSVVSLCRVSCDRFGYALANGVVGLYEGSERFWRIKTRNIPVCMHSLDVDGDGVPELITGWSSGKVDVRRSKTGEIIFKDSFSTHISGIVQADYRGDGKEQLICCSGEGEIRGYLPSSPTGRGGEGGRREEGEGEERVLEQWKIVEELNQRKEILLLELKNFEAFEKASSSSPPKSQISPGGESGGVIPAGTLLKTEFSAILPEKGQQQPNKMGPHIELSVEATNDTIIKAVVIFADGLFDGESHIVHPPPSQLKCALKIPLFPEKDVPINLNIRAFVGLPRSTRFHVFEASRDLARFSLYIPCPPATKPHPLGRVQFTLRERLARVNSWLEKEFMYPPDKKSPSSPSSSPSHSSSSSFHVAYLSLRTSLPLILKFEPSQNSTFTIETDDMVLAGDVIQSLAAYLGLDDLAVTASFPKHMEELKDILEKVDEFHKIRQKLTAEMADNSSIIRNLVVRAEDARIMHDISNMKKAYSQLFDLNHDLIVGYTIRSNNHLELLECLRIVNQAIQRAGNLRVGKPKTRVISACRAAIKSNDSDTLLKVMMGGAS